MNYDEKLSELFIDLPEPPTVSSWSSNAVQVGKLLFINGVLPLSDGRISSKGRVGLELNTDNARRAARVAAVNCLGIVSAYCKGSVNKVKQIVSVTAFISSGGDFRDHFKVLDGASELLQQIFGSAGKHTRNAVGCSNLPNDACIELSMIVELK